MPFNGLGVYSPIGAPDFPAVADTTIRAAQYNNEINDIATALTLCVTRDGQSPATANLPMGGFRHTSVAAATARTDYARAAELQDNTYRVLGTVAGTNTITAVGPLSLAAYVVGQVFDFIPANTNTGATTLNINTIGAGAILFGGAALTGGELVAGVPARVVVSQVTPSVQFGLDASRTLLLPADIQKLTQTLATVGGSGTAITATQSPATATAKVVDLIIGTANGGAATTLAVNGGTAKSVKAYSSAGAKVDTTLVVGQYCRFVDDGTYWILVNSLPPTAAVYLTGQVVQAVSVTKTGTWSTSSTSMTDVTGLSASITPRKNTNKILAIVSIALNGQSTVSAHAQLVRGSTAIGIGDAAGSRTRSTLTVTGNASYVSGSATANFVDSPATTSATTYKVQAMTGQGGTTAYVNRSQNDADSADNGRGISTLTLLEIDA